MKTAVIRQRVADFLGRHAPFDELPATALQSLAGSGRVKFHESEELIVQQGGAPGASLFMIQQGRVEILDERSGEPRLCDVLGEGDLLGLDRFLGDGKHRYTARTASDVILYSIDAAQFNELAAEHPAVKRFVAAHLAMPGSWGIERKSWLDAEPPPPAFLRAGAVEGLPAMHTPLSTREAIRLMIAGGADAVAVADGVPTGRDLALFCGHDPAYLLQRIRDAESVDELGPLLGRARHVVVEALGTPDDVDDCIALTTQINAAAFQAATRLAAREVIAAGMDCPSDRYCWIAFGAAARGELLEPSLPNIAVVYDDALAPETAIWFTAVAGQTIARLHACGLEGPGLVWPEGAHACMPLSEWQRFYSESLRDPIGNGLYERREFLDARVLSGDAGLFDALRAHVAEELAAAPMVTALLANDTLAHLPPLTFFGGMVLQLDGGHTERFDLRKTAVLPVSDAARVLALGHGGLAASGTLSRLAEVSGPVFDDAANAFRAALYFEALSGTPMIDAATVGRYDQRLLKTAFSAIQRLLECTESMVRA